MKILWGVLATAVSIIGLLELLIYNDLVDGLSWLTLGAVYIVLMELKK